MDVGNLVYQVQLSRYPQSRRRRGPRVPRGPAGRHDGAGPGDETWFGVWMRVKNYSNETPHAGDEITIVDTEDNEYRPVPLADTTVRLPADPLGRPANGAAQRRNAAAATARSRAR